jgi:acyl carrier protein
MTDPTNQVVSPFGDDPVERRVLEIIVERSGTAPEKMDRDTRLMPDVTDSLGVTEIVMDLEEEFEGSIPEETAEQIQTVGQLIDHVKTHLASVKTGP